MKLAVPSADKMISALSGALVSRVETVGGQPANIVDAGFAIARSMTAVAAAITVLADKVYVGLEKCAGGKK